jgi:hypothetical protein
MEWLPRSLNELLTSWLLKRFCRVAWAIRNTRNKYYIRRRFPNKSIDVVLFGVSFTQNWKKREPAKGQVETLVQTLMGEAKEFKSSEVNPSDIEFI